MSRPAAGRDHPATPRAVVLGVGNEFRRDDGAGPHVIGQLRHLVTDRAVRLMVVGAEPAGLLDAWSGVALAVVVDAVRRDPCVPGRTHRIVVESAAAGHDRAWPCLPGGQGRPAAGPEPGLSSHDQGLAAAIGLGQALDRMPGRLIVHAVEATEFGYGIGLTPAVAAAARAVIGSVLRDLAAGTAP